ncbi:MAG: hypothetical protein AAF602_18170, partial [Myxococcota bacterium]
TEALIEVGALDQAEDQIRELSREPDPPVPCVGMIAALRGHLALARGQPKEAESAFVQGFAELRDDDAAMPRTQAVVGVHLARLLADRGALDEAASILGEAAEATQARRSEVIASMLQAGEAAVARGRAAALRAEAARLDGEASQALESLRDGPLDVARLVDPP